MQLHDAFTVGIPLLAILAAILLNDQQGRDIRGEMRDLRGEISAMRSDIHADARALNQIAFTHENRITALEKGKASL